MSEYVAPLKDMQFVLDELADFSAVRDLPGHQDVSSDLAQAILGESGRFASGILSPLNASGDREGATWQDGQVRTARGWREAYRQFVDGGWNALSCPTAYGGQGLPRLISAFVEEIWNGANMAFSLCPMLTRGAIEALELCGTQEQKALYLPRLVSGIWTGTMNLTEPGAGSDLAAVRTRAIPQPDGAFRLIGQKIFITYGEHDLAENIVHLVLARTPDAPEGVKGISLFVVPKFLVAEDGRLGARNDVRCVSIEHKLGIHASPTAVLAFGDEAGALGWLVGKENRGLEYMFIMMNAARFSVGIEGIGLCERAYQRARAYARERVQGTELGSGNREKVAIIRHPDVRRMLLQMKTRTEALRAVAAVVAASMDSASLHLDPDVRRRNQAFVELMIPIVKGWSTETSVLVSSIGVQVHGGVGYIEETGAAQHLRDARITPIYEGTTGIQAADLIGRKIARDGGRAMEAVLERMRAVRTRLAAVDDSNLIAIGNALDRAIGALGESTRFIVNKYASDVGMAAAGAVPMLELFGTTAGGWQMARAALAAYGRLREAHADREFLHAKILSARFYADHVLSTAPGLAQALLHGGEATLRFPEAEL